VKLLSTEEQCEYYKEKYNQAVVKIEQMEKENTSFSDNAYL
jgi:hypothetical protein